MFPILDGLARERLAAAALVGRRAVIDVPTDEATEHVLALLMASGADVVADPTAELAIRHAEVACANAVCRVPLLDPMGDAQATVRAVLRLTNRRLPATRVAVVGFDERRRALAGVLRALGGRVVVVDADPVRRWSAVVDGHDVGPVGDATLVFADSLTDDVADGAVVAGPPPPADSDEVRPGVHRLDRHGRQLLVLDPAMLAGGRAIAWLDLMWATRLVALSWLASSAPGAGQHELPAEHQRELAASALEARVSSA